MRRILAAILIAMLGSGPVLAQISRYPALYFVTGVDEGDTLNVRSLPDAESGILEKLAPDARGIEVTAEDASGQWGRVNSGELAGWVSLRYLTRHETGDFAFSERLDCFGAEPFWALIIEDGKSARLKTLTGPEQSLPAGLITGSVNRTDRYLLGLGEGMLAVLRQADCDNGMSDQLYGLDMDLISTTGEMALRQGCCSLRLSE